MRKHQCDGLEVIGRYYTVRHRFSGWQLLQERTFVDDEMILAHCKYCYLCGQELLSE
jgi:hypothetical protein